MTPSLDDEALGARLADYSDGIRAAAVFDPDGAQLAASDGRDWSREAEALWRAASVGGAAVQVHVGGSDGEVLALRSAAGAVLATADRFALSSLVFSDLRALLRELDSPAAGT